jgi:hypothetical protein
MVSPFGGDGPMDPVGASAVRPSGTMANTESRKGRLCATIKKPSRIVLRKNPRQDGQSHKIAEKCSEEMRLISFGRC